MNELQQEVQRSAIATARLAALQAAVMGTPVPATPNDWHWSPALDRANDRQWRDQIEAGAKAHRYAVVRHRDPNDPSLTWRFTGESCERARLVASLMARYTLDQAHVLGGAESAPLPAATITVLESMGIPTLAKALIRGGDALALPGVPELLAAIGLRPEDHAVCGQLASMAQGVAATGVAKRRDLMTFRDSNGGLQVVRWADWGVRPTARYPASAPTMGPFVDVEHVTMMGDSVKFTTDPANLYTWPCIGGIAPAFGGTAMPTLRQWWPGDLPTVSGAKWHRVGPYAALLTAGPITVGAMLPGAMAVTGVRRWTPQYPALTGGAFDLKAAQGMVDMVWEILRGQAWGPPQPDHKRSYAEHRAIPDDRTRGEVCRDVIRIAAAGQDPVENARSYVDLCVAKKIRDLADVAPFLPSPHHLAVYPPHLRQ